MSQLAVFLLQLIIIVIASRAVGYLFKKIGQPAVMGEIIAGIILGPSLFGTLFPGYLDYVFPANSMEHLKIFSQIGLILFMFVVGMELDMNIIRQRATTATAISITSIVFPYALGVGLAYYLHRDFAPVDVPFHAFALFMGIAMSITAFPVLARIIKEKGISDTRHGSLAITSAAVDDVSGWCILALVIAIVKADSLNASLYTVIYTLIYLAVMLFVIRPLLRYFSKIKMQSNIIKQSTIALLFIIMIASSLCTEVIGIHALFGAFMAGVIMPHEWNIRNILIDKIEDVALILLLPLFFAITGLRTEIGSLNSPHLWAICLLIIALAITGKLGGSAIAAKLSGESNYSSLAVGILMNTRGLMELVILNIGYELKILNQQVFTMMVIMALVTTFMTTPLLNILDRRKNKMSI